MSTDGVESRSAAVALGLGLSDTELNRALDGWLAGFVDGPSGLKFVHRNEKVRIYSIA